MNLDEFLAALRKTPRTWSRVAMRDGEGMCPICAVCRTLGKGRHVNHRYKEAARAIGLDSQVASFIAAVADGKPDPFARTLEEACGVRP